MLRSEAGRMTRATPGDLSGCALIEREAHDEGPRAFRELERLRAECRLAGEAIAVRLRLGNNLGNKLSKTQKRSTAENSTNTGSSN